MKSPMPHGPREVEVRLPRELHARLVAVAKAKKRSVSALIVSAVAADLRPNGRNFQPHKHHERKTH
jgi:hypothetical protein